MDKKALLEYALFARKELETQIALSLNKIGIYDDHVSYAHIVGDRTIIEGISESFDKRVYDLRKRIADECLKDQKFSTLVEEFAYTWFNRIIAIRFMEVHDYFPHGFRVLTSKDGSYEPEILKNLPYVLDELDLDIEVVQSLKEQNKTEELYRYVLIKQCNALSPIFPELFDKQESYLEYLLPNNLLGQDSVIRKIKIIPEIDFLNDIEIVGWLYQYYVASNREEYRKAKKVTKDLIPTLSQIFTPDWIVRYMVDNSVGRLWCESYPQTALKEKLHYYVENNDFDAEVKNEIERIKYKNVNPEEIKVIEPCCGSGHILVYVFDLLFDMYVEKGYTPKEIPTLILKNNLFGLDIDKRASQLANFSLVMKARSVDSRFFNEDRFVRPNVYEIKDSQGLFSSNFEASMISLHFSKSSIELAKYLSSSFSLAKEIGSLLKIEKKDYTSLLSDIERCENIESPGLYEQDFYHYGLPLLKQLIKLADLMSDKYDVMITNPPYLLTAKMDELVKKYYVKNYPNSKDDLSVMFMETGFVKRDGFTAIVNPDGWMFISSFIKVRDEIIKNKAILTAMHLEMGAFEAVVQTTSFVMRNCSLKYMPYKTMKVSEPLDFGKNIFIKQLAQYEKIPLQRFAYWINDTVLESFKCQSMSEYIDAKAGMVTGDADRFLRFWWEIDFSKIGFNNRQLKWIPYQKGGNYRRWYGNNEYVVNWENDGYDMKCKNSDEKGRIRSHNYNGDWGFRRALTWTEFSSSDYSCRIVKDGFLFDSSGPMCFVFDINKQNNVLALFNSKVANYYFNLFNPTVHYLPSNLLEMPAISDRIFDYEISKCAEENIKIAKFDWDKQETSWDFKTHFLIDGCSKISDAYYSFYKMEEERFDTQKANEEKINEKFINLYNLNDVLQKEISPDKITYKKVTSKEAVKSLISYLVGCLMGRYELSNPGIKFAGGLFDDHCDYCDDDGILPIYKFIGIESGLTSEICNLIKKIYGVTYYKENIDFVAENLGRRNNEGPEETINRYLNDEFFADHIKLYKKRPIYWMFNSGKNGAFKCLLYIHRYNKNTLALLNSKYFLPRTALYKAEYDRISDKLRMANDNKQKRELEKELQFIDACQQELLEYGQVLDHMANQFIDLDLDEGVKTNYCKFQSISLEINGATIKKDLLVEFGLNDKKKKGAE